MIRSPIRVPGVTLKNGQLHFKAGAKPKTAKPKKFKLTPKKPVITEADVTKSICDFLALKGWMPIRLQSGVFRGQRNTWITIGEPGIPDWICAHPKHGALFIEMKRPGKKRSPKQIAWHQRAAVLGLRVVTPDDFDKFVAWYRAEYGR